MSATDENAAAAAGDAADEVAAFNPALLKKKKKKKKKKKDKEAADADAAAAAAAPDALAPTGSAGSVGAVSWAGSDRDYTYTEMLERVFETVRQKNPNLHRRKRHTMPPPSLRRVGTRKTMWSNFPQICQVMQRNTDHVVSFVLAELVTEGSLDGSRRLVMRGRFTPQMIESLLKKYIIEYVTCSMCRNPETTLTRDSTTRLYFIQCESCGSRRSVAPIKSAFTATMRADRRRARN